MEEIQQISPKAEDKANPEGDKKKKNNKWIGIGIGLGILGILVIIVIIVVSSNLNKSGESGKKHYRCTAQGCGMVETCDADLETNCFLSLDECENACGNYKGFACDNQVCDVSLCNPDTDERCYPDLKTCTNTEHCGFPPELFCNAQGTRRIDNKQCVCWDHVTGTDCSSCEKGYGPEFPCCFLEQLPVEATDRSSRPVTYPYCIANQDEWGANPNANRMCSTPAGGCYGYPTFIYYIKRKTPFPEQADRPVCDAFVYQNTDIPYQIDPTQSLKEIEKEFDRLSSTGAIVRSPVYCEPNAIEKAKDMDQSQKVMINQCTAKFSVDACRFPVNVNKPVLYFTPYGLQETKSLTHP